MLNLECHCGNVRLSLEKRPEYVHECNCTACRKTGARWAYLDPSQVKIEGEANAYCRQDKADPAASFQFCGNCGSSTHWTLTDSAIARYGNGMIGVNMRLADESDLAGLELRFPNGKAWSGEGPFDYAREPVIFGAPTDSH